MHAVTSEDDYEMITEIQQKLSFQKILPAKSIGEILHELLQELHQLKSELTGLISSSSILKTFRIFSDEPKSSSPYEYRSFGTEKVRFGTEQMTDLESTASNARINPNQTSNTYRFRRQQQIGDDNFPVIPRKRTEKIQSKEALDILEPYYARYRIRCAGKFEICQHILLI